MYQIMEAGESASFWDFDLADHRLDPDQNAALIADRAAAEVTATGAVQRFNWMRYSQMRCGVPVDGELFGSHARQNPDPDAMGFYRAARALPEVIWPNGILAVSERLRSIIDSIEPDVHQFLPVTATTVENCVPPTRFRLVNVLNWADAYDYERSGFRRNAHGGWETPPDPIKHVARRPPLVGKHLAIGSADTYRRFIVSQVLADAIGELPDEYASALKYTPLHMID